MLYLQLIFQVKILCAPTCPSVIYCVQDNNIYVILYSQNVTGILYVERRGKGLHLLAKRRQRHALVFRFTAYAHPRNAHMQCHREYGTGKWVMCQLEPLLHGVQISGRESFPGYHIVRQHRLGLGSHIRCKYPKVN